MPKKISIGKNYYKELVELLPRSVSKLTGVKVAAILVTDKGIFKGVNYEDLVCSLSICAERNALFNAITNGMKQIYEVHILGTFPNMGPCGACRQLLYAYGGDNVRIYSYTYCSNKRSMVTLGHLLPNAPYEFKKGKKK